MNQTSLADSKGTKKFCAQASQVIGHASIEHLTRPIRSVARLLMCISCQTFQGVASLWFDSLLPRRCARHQLGEFSKMIRALLSCQCLSDSQLLGGESQTCYGLRSSPLVQLARESVCDSVYFLTVKKHGECRTQGRAAALTTFGRTPSYSNPSNRSTRQCGLKVSLLRHSPATLPSR